MVDGFVKIVIISPLDFSNNIGLSWQKFYEAYDGSNVVVNLPLTYSSVYSVQTTMIVTTWGTDETVAAQQAVSWASGLLTSYNNTSVTLRRTGKNSNCFIFVTGSC